MNLPGINFVVGLVRWIILIGATLVALGVCTPFGSSAHGLAGDVGPIEVSVLPAVGLNDGQTVAIHVSSTDPAVLIYSVAAHLCVSDKVTGDRSFSFAGVACTNVPVGQSDVERLNVTGGSGSADLEFRVGTGSASWLSSTGYTGTISCGAGAKCDLALRIEVTDSTLYYRTPLCFGAGCPRDPDAPPPPPPTTIAAAQEPPDAVAADGAVASSGGKAVPGGSTTGGAKSGSTGASSSRSGNGDSGSAAAQGAAMQSRVSVGSDNPTGWTIKLGAAALAGALGGARIVSVVSATRRRRAGLGVSG